MATSPSGAQYEIRHGDQRATVVEVGGGLRVYDVAGRPVVDGYDEAAICDGARGQTLVPWPNRVRDGSWGWGGSRLQLPLTEPEQRNAIHGLVRWASWSPQAVTESSVTLQCASPAQPGYPWTLHVENQWTLGSEGLSVRTTITNRSDQPAPVAAGFHPYITVGTPHIDTALLHVPAATWLPTGDQQIPTGREPVEGTPWDFRAPRPIEQAAIDYTFTDLDRDDQGRAWVTLTDPGNGAAVAVWADSAYSYLEVYTGDTLPDPRRRRQGLGVEPMSAPPNGLATGESLTVLDPQASWTGNWGMVRR